MWRGTAVVLGEPEGVDYAIQILHYSAKVVGSLAQHQSVNRMRRFRGVSEKMEVLYDALYNARTVHRMFDLFAAYEMLSTVKADPKAQLLARLKGVALLLSSPLELIAFFLDLLSTNEKLTGKIDRLSCVTWAIYIFFDVLYILYKIRHLNHHLTEYKAGRSPKPDRHLFLQRPASTTSRALTAPRATSSESTTTAPTIASSKTGSATATHTTPTSTTTTTTATQTPFSDEDEQQQQLQRRIKKRNRQRNVALLRLLSVACELPIALAWSFKSSPLPDLWIGLCGLASAATGMYLTSLN
eukprot:TRINITY_DN131_c3_g1_i2.p1 TRINITY_DN131_c3_g1~~TRINITY_DN131_c3_g1_i2.p1  ORF type:complete len:299 (-),score=77.82 TRINITY_DN131_c3_g1_i2:49-945(-)